MTKITTILFDCDNTLVMSEPIAFEACAQLLNRICAEKGLKTDYTGPILMDKYVGRNFRGMLQKVREDVEEFKISDEEIETWVPKEEVEVINKLKVDLVACDGADEQLEKIAKEKDADGKPKYELAVVSSSAHRRLLASVEKVGYIKYFPSEKLFSAATSLEKPTSKPDPAIYNFAMKQLGDKKATECVAIEDSRSGASSAVNAKIKTIGYIGSYEPHEREEKKKILEDAGACIIMEHWSEFPECLRKIIADEV